MKSLESRFGDPCWSIRLCTASWENERPFMTGLLCQLGYVVYCNDLSIDAPLRRHNNAYYISRVYNFITVYMHPVYVLRYYVISINSLVSIPGTSIYVVWRCFDISYVANFSQSPRRQLETRIRCWKWVALWEMNAWTPYEEALWAWLKVIDPDSFSKIMGCFWKWSHLQQNLT